MKVLTLALLLSITSAKPTLPVRQPSGQVQKLAKGGRWYFAANGHAVYCYGPVMFVTGPTGDLQRVATFCQNDQAVVPLKE